MFVLLKFIIHNAALAAFGGIYDAFTQRSAGKLTVGIALGKMVDRASIINQALALILP